MGFFPPKPFPRISLPLAKILFRENEQNESNLNVACFVDGQYYFPNEFENRNVVALPDRVWSVDLFSSPAPLAGGGPLKILLIIDVGSKDFLCLHPFKSRAVLLLALLLK